MGFLRNLAESFAMKWEFVKMGIFREIRYNIKTKWDPTLAGKYCRTSFQNLFRYVGGVFAKIHFEVKQIFENFMKWGRIPTFYAAVSTPSLQELRAI